MTVHSSSKVAVVDSRLVCGSSVVTQSELGAVH